LTLVIDLNPENLIFCHIWGFSKTVNFIPGIYFKEDTIRGERIKEGQAYERVRIHLDAFFAGTKSRFNLQIDIGFEDKVTPKLEVLNTGLLITWD
jgi:hypothetical protein